MSMAYKQRVGKAQFFVRFPCREDGRYNGTQLGVTTQNDDDEYQVSYVELGARCDHLVDPIIAATRKRRIDALADTPGISVDAVSTAPTTDDPFAYDSDLFDDEPKKEKEVAKPELVAV